MINEMLLSLMAEVYVAKDLPYSLYGNENFVLLRTRTSLYVINFVLFIGYKLWQTLSVEIKESHLLKALIEPAYLARVVS